MTALESLTTVRFPAVTPRNRLEQLLAHLADVRQGEGVGALLFAFNFFLLLSAYYMGMELTDEPRAGGRLGSATLL